MTATAAFPAERLAAEAREAYPGRAMATAIIAIFTGLGWLAGTEITGLIFCALSARYGYRIGRGLPPDGPVRKPPGTGPPGSKL